MRTRTFKLEKLVRDKIVNQHTEQGGEIVHHSLSPEEKRVALLRKIIEEAEECLTSERPISEIADIREVLGQLAVEEGLTEPQVEAEQARKRAENGGFENGDYIETETWPADHHWAEYYAKEPNRFPEVNE